MLPTPIPTQSTPDAATDRSRPVCIVRYLQIGTGSRLSPSACSEMSVKKKTHRSAFCAARCSANTYWDSWQYLQTPATLADNCPTTPSFLNCPYSFRLFFLISPLLISGRSQRAANFYDVAWGSIVEHLRLARHACTLADMYVYK